MQVVAGRLVKYSFQGEGVVPFFFCYFLTNKDNNWLNKASFGKIGMFSDKFCQQEVGYCLN